MQTRECAHTDRARQAAEEADQEARHRLARGAQDLLDGTPTD
jgi:hypothetical protein